MDIFKVNQSSFFNDVYDVVRLIPFGKVTTYGAIAKYLGSAKSARVVGYAMNASHGLVPAIPAHRVVNRRGVLTGKHFFGTDNRMQKLLEAEGLTIVNDVIKDFDLYFWDPNKELQL
jgi:methylated-DNA-protein-cysteine methyltransferase-like protein